MSTAATETTIRTFRGPDAHTALLAVKAAFGQDAVILETKQVSGGIFGKAQVEITAASGGGSVVARTAAFEKAAARAAAGARGGFGEPAPATKLTERGQLSDRGPLSDRSHLSERPLLPRRERLTNAVPRSAHDDSEADSLREEIAALRRTIQQFRGRVDDDGDSESGVDTRLPDRAWSSEGRRLFARLVRQGLDETLAHNLLRAAHEDGADRGPVLAQHVVRALSRRLPVADAPWSPHARRTIAFIGPTGVGKTTAMAKIAARALLESRFKVALITVDTYRVGASDQLARYGKIMGVPTFVARDAQALSAAFANCREADLVLIDTAGRADAESTAEQAALVRTVPNVQLHLTLSAATGSRELAAATRRYQRLNPERFIFTKLDEADGPASVLSATALLPAAISCVCDGQRVPEDIHAESSSALVSRLVGLEASGMGAA